MADDGAWHGPDDGAAVRRTSDDEVEFADPRGETLRLDRGCWDAFLAAVRADQIRDPQRPGE